MARTRRKQEWKVGDVFAIPLMDGDIVLAQIVGREASVLNSVSIAVFDVKCRQDQFDTASSFLEASRAFAVLFSTKESLDAGQWPVLESRPVALPQSMQPHENLRSNRFVGADVYGSATIDKFVNAFYGLLPWDGYKDPLYLDKLLLSSDKKPDERLIYKPRG